MISPNPNRQNSKIMRILEQSMPGMNIYHAECFLLKTNYSQYNICCAKNICL